MTMISSPEHTLDQTNKLPLKAICIVSTLVSAALALVCLFIGWQRLAIGIAVGAAVSMASLIVIKAMVSGLIASRSFAITKRKIRRLKFATIARYAVIGVIIWAAMKYGGADGIGIVTGASVTFFIMLVLAFADAVRKELRLSRGL